MTFHDDQTSPSTGGTSRSGAGIPARAGSGVLLEHSIHDVDLLELLGGPLATVAATASHTHGIAGIEDLVTATFAYASGAHANLTTVWHDIPERLNDRRIEVVCERLWASLEGDWIGPLRWQRPGAARRGPPGRGPPRPGRRARADPTQRRRRVHLGGRLGAARVAVASADALRAPRVGRRHLPRRRRPLGRCHRPTHDLAVGRRVRLLEVVPTSR